MYLRERQMSIGESSWLLGYTEAAGVPMRAVRRPPYPIRLGLLGIIRILWGPL